MPNEEIKEVSVDEETEVETPEEELNEDTTDWKAEALKARGMAARNATRLEKLKNAKVETPTQVQKVDKREGFDYAEKAYLKASGIASDEYSLVQEIMTSTGKSLDEVLEAKYFKAELNERRELKASKDAIPSGSKRSASSARDSVEYWISKGELPPPDQRELRQKVVNARMKSEQDKTQFADRSVV